MQEKKYSELTRKKTKFLLSFGFKKLEKIPAENFPLKIGRMFETLFQNVSGHTGPEGE
jgi:hypothetical protein